MSRKSSQGPLRFVHASDLHLEQPLHGIGEVPELFTDVFLNAPFLAAERVFDIAVRERADFLILAGDVVLPLAAGPRGLDFLLSQFRRLERENVTIYWAAGQIDEWKDWPTAVPLPSNVVCFDDEHVDSITHHRGNQPIAVIQGRASNKSSTFSAGEFDANASLPTIVTVFGKTDDPLHRSDVAYWALGGVHGSAPGCQVSDHDSVGQETAWYCGSPQGRRPLETGPHGCCLVEIDVERRADRRFIATDVVRWHNELFDLPDVIDRDGLLRWFRDRTHQLLENAGDRQLLVRWVIRVGDERMDTKSDAIVARLREGGLADELLESLRREFGTSTPPVWHVEVEAEPPAKLPSGWYEEDTVLGELLRAVQHYQQNETHACPPLDIAGIPADISDSLREISCHEREMILRSVAALGVDLLCGNRVPSEESDPKSPEPGVMAGGL